MNKPFFSIVIPTRGRPGLLRDAIMSALYQDFDDFEVVVSDNFNDSLTEKTIAQLRAHDRLRCIRTSRLLSMPEHWEFASRHAHGTYILILTDRSVLKKDALKIIYDTIQKATSDVSVCAWRWSSYDTHARQEFDDIPIRTGKAEVLQSSFVVSEFIKSGRRSMYILPRGLNSCYRHDVARSLREQYGSLFKEMSPDYTSAFLLLAHIDILLFIDQPLFISQGLEVSNGGRSYRGYTTDYLRSLGEIDWFSKVPIKVPLVENSIYQDYFVIQELAGGTLKQVPMDWVEYFLRCYREIIEKKGAGLLPDYELKSLYAEWCRALRAFDSSLQKEVSRRVRRLFWLKLKVKLRNSSIRPLVKKAIWAMDRMRCGQWPFSGGYSSVLEAAGFRLEN